MRGKFVVIDGIGASGKDTQVEMLENYLKDKGMDFLVTREHTRDTPPGILIEKIIKKQEDQIEGQALQLLFISDRRNHFVKVIKPESKNRNMTWHDINIRIIKKPLHELREERFIEDRNNY
jgi:dTMP kinase